jgi:single-strand DNA-binding protein
MLPTITITGRAIADAELRFTPAGAAVCNFRIAANDSKKLDDGTWENQEAIFVNVAVWKDDAETVAESVRKGDELIVTGRIFNGEKRSSLEMKFPTVAKIIKAPRGQGQSRPAQSAPAGVSAADPWGALNTSDEVPF